MALNSIKAMLRAVLARCHPERILQRATEVALIGESCLNGNFGKRVRGRCERAAREFKPTLTNVFAYSTAIMAFERRRHINRVDPNGCCNIRQDRGPGKAFVQDIANPVQPGRSLGAARGPEAS